MQSEAAVPEPSVSNDSADRAGILLYLYIGAVLLPVWFSVGPLAMSLLRLLLIVVTLPLLFNLMRRGYGRVLPTDILFILHVFWAGIALFVNNPEQVVQQIGSVGVEFLGGYAVGRACIRSKAAFLTLCRLLMATVLVLMPFALYEALTGNPLIIRWIHALPGFNSVIAGGSDKRFGLERVQSVFAHPIHHGLYCSVVLSLVFVALRDQISHTWRWIAASLVFLTGFLALASGAFLAMLLQIFLFSWAFFFAKYKKRWLILVMIIFFCYIIVDLISHRSPVMVFLHYATFNAHTAYWRTIIFDWGLANVIGSAEKSIVGSPLFGIGLNEWVRPAFMYSGSMDNFWLVMAVRYGVPGFLFIALGYLWALNRVMRRDLTADPALARIRLAWVFTFVGLTFTLCTVHVWASIYSFTFFIFGAGIWLIDDQRKGEYGNLGEHSEADFNSRGQNIAQYNAHTSTQRR